MATIRGPDNLWGWRPAIAWGIVAFAIHSVGNDIGLYARFGWYQNLTHAASASALAGLLLVAGVALGYRRGRLVAFVVGMAVVFALGWEAVEYLGLLDGFGVPLHFHDIHDAMIDMGANAVGVTVTLYVAWATTGLEPRGLRSD